MTTISRSLRATSNSGERESIFRIVLISVLGYEAAGAIVGGILLSIRPDGGLFRMPIQIMHGFFQDFFMPGLILLALGAIATTAFTMVVRRATTDWIMVLIALGGFMIWFVVEIIVIQELHWLHLVWGVPILLGLIASIPLMITRISPAIIQPLLLASGVASSLWYLAINIYIPAGYDGYSVSDLTVSELSAIGSPTRILWVLLVSIYPLLLAAFGFGVVERSNNNSLLRSTGFLIIFYCILNLYWPPMHMRGEEPTLTDVLHIAWASVTVLLMIAMMVTGAIAIKGSFRIYTILSIIVHLIFGVATFKNAANIPVDGPTPLIGLWERINIAVFMLWIIILAIVLFTTDNKPGVFDKKSIQ